MRKPLAFTHIILYTANTIENHFKCALHSFAPITLLFVPIKVLKGEFTDREITFAHTLKNRNKMEQ